MTPELVDDLKQFFEAVLVQNLSSIERRLDNHDRRFEQIDQRFDRLEQRFSDLELKFDTVTDTFGAMLIDHDKRLGRLEALKA